jgi:translation initiation factor IF-2
MADVTISELAGVVGVSVDKLLSQIKEAGLPHTKADELISNDDKNTLLVFLRRSHGDRDATSAAPKKITLKRKTLGTLKSASSTGRGKTVNVEVRKKRTYVKRSAIETPVEEELPAAELEP